MLSVLYFVVETLKHMFIDYLLGQVITKLILNYMTYIQMIILKTILFQLFTCIFYFILFLYINIFLTAYSNS